MNTEFALGVRGQVTSNNDLVLRTLNETENNVSYSELKIGVADLLRVFIEIFGQVDVKSEA